MLTDRSRSAWLARFTASLLLALLTIGPAGAAAPADLADLDGFVDQALADWDVPGLALAVVQGDQVLVAKGYGLRDVDGKKPVTAQTVFPIGSATKAFTTSVLASLVEEGKLAWDRPVTTWLPGFALYDPRATAEITPRDLATHRSGLPRHDAIWYSNPTVSRKELISRLPYLPNNESLRARFQYNNLMFLTAGYLIEQVSGKSWEDNVRERIWRPLGMSSSGFSAEDAEATGNYALPYTRRDDKLTRIPFRDNPAIGPAGSIYSNLDDMVRWVKVHLKTGDRQLFGPAAIDELHAPQMVLGIPGERPEISPASYALGWFTDVYRGHSRVYHGGNIDGFTALVSLLPQDHLGIVVLTNRDTTGLPEQVVRRVADRLLGLPPTDWYADATARRKATLGAQRAAEGQKDLFRHEGTQPAHPLADYAGDYEHPGYGVLQFRLVNDHLEVTYNSLKAPLAHHHYEVFRAGRGKDDRTLADTLFLFHGDPAGNVSGVSFAIEPAVPDALFKRKVDARYQDPTWLARFAGDYDLGYQQLHIAVSGNGLLVEVPRQLPSPLEPRLGGEFVLTRQRSVRLRFKEEGDKVVGLYLIRDTGVFEGKKK